MCGIIGFNWEDSSLLKRILKEIKYRGPDDSGYFTDKRISLGHNRLSIIDLSSSGRQPMSNEDETVWIVFNGEIYNFKEIRNNLKRKHNFKSNTDTEVLIHLYEEEGVKMLKKIRGMFAFCIYDVKKKTLFLARDRAGIKPLYYYEKQGKFMFCSELKGILMNKEVKREINKDALASFLVFRANCLEDSIFCDIKKLKPGNFLIYNLKDHQLSIEKYWDLEIIPENKSESFFIKKLRNLLEESVKDRLITDVPYGAYLSGGVDSGTIVSLMNKFSPQEIKTFSVGFEGEKPSELEGARFLSEKIGTDHHELIIGQNAVKYLPEIIYQADEPMSDPTSIPIYLLSKYAKKYCTVILTGEGADELFGGYPQYKFMKYHYYFVKNLPRFSRKSITKIVENSPKKLLNKGFKFASDLGEKGVERFSNFLSSNNYSEQYLNQIAIFNESEQSEIMGKNIEIYKKYLPYFKNSKKIGVTSCCQLLDFKEPMVEDLLMKIDKNTMASSIEGRVPFLDHRIIEFSGKIPSSLKLKGFTKDKYILRKSVKDLIPEQTRKRKKRHFFVPINNWFSKDLAAIREELLSKRYIEKQKIFKYNYIKKMNEGFRESELFYSRQLWTLLTFQIWYKRYVEDEQIKI